MATRDFGIVSPKIFIDKLMKYGLDEDAVRWIKKYLSGQAQGW